MRACAGCAPEGWWAVIEVTPEQIAQLAAAIDFHLSPGWPARPELARKVLDAAPGRIAAMLEAQTDLRDMFAAHAMQSLMLDPSFKGSEPEDIAAAAYEQADAMLKARKGGG